MGSYRESEKRRFVRLPTTVSVTYRFISQVPVEGRGPHGTLRPGGSVPREVYEGQTANLAAGGMLLVGPIPDKELIADLLMQKVIVGVEMQLDPTGAGKSIHALCRVSWVEAVEEKESRYGLGLRFVEITSAAQDEIFRYVISNS